MEEDGAGKHNSRETGSQHWSCLSRERSGKPQIMRRECEDGELCYEHDKNRQDRAYICVWIQQNGTSVFDLRHVPWEASMAPAVSWKSSSCCRNRMAWGGKQCFTTDLLLIVFLCKRDNEEILHCLWAHARFHLSACCTLYLDRSVGLEDITIIINITKRSEERHLYLII